MGGDWVKLDSWPTFGILSSLDMTKSGQNRLEGVFRRKDPGTRGYSKEFESLCPFHSRCVSYHDDALFHASVSRNFCFRGRTQVEAGSRTVLGIGPGKSPVVSEGLLFHQFAHSYVAPVELINKVTGDLRLL